MPFRITTWNVNGIRNPFGYQPWRETRSFEAMFDILEADIVVIQECKIQRKDLKDDMVLVPGWDVFFSLPKHKKGYSGVAIYTRNSTCCPIRAEEGITGALCPPNSTTSYRDLSDDKRIGGYPRVGQLTSSIDDLTLDSEGRCVILEFPSFVLIGTYAPANRDESRDEFRLAYLEALDVRARNLVAAGKSVILLGDLNVIRNELDSAGILDQLRKDGLTIEDFLSNPYRRLFNQLVFGGRVFGSRDAGREMPILHDLARLFHPDRRGMYTCWDTKTNARPGNFGSRIDYILCSENIKNWFSFANIQEGLMGSDHCPVYASLKDRIVIKGHEVDVKDVLNPPGTFKNGERKRDWSVKSLLPLSGRLIPEFDRRQNIKDMFFKTASMVDNSKTLGSKLSAPSPDLPGLSPFPDVPVNSTGSSLVIGQSSPAQATVTSKRGVDSTTSSRPAKRPKPVTLTKAKNVKAVEHGQATLSSFFKPKDPTSYPPEEEALVQFQGGADTPKTTTPKSHNLPSSLNTAQQDISSSESPGRLVDPIVSKESWSKLLSKRMPPKCQHGELCISLTTKKPGPNKGRSFYICPRPLGPSGQKETGTEWRCSTFIWSSDWITAASLSSSTADHNQVPFSSAFPT